jgi:hypothetical protein
MPERLYVVGDTETLYDSKNKYSLRSKGMDNASYLLDPRFERIGTAFKINGQKTGWIDGPEVPRFLRSLGDPERVVFIAHNLLFDACELAWHAGWIAGFYVDTLALSRALLGHVLLRHDLDSVSRYLGVGAKGDTVHKVDGMTRQMIIDAGFYEEYAAYSCLDADLCWGIFQHLAPVMPPDELAINDIVHRMAIQPVLRTDPSTLHEHLAQVIARKEWLLARAGLQDRETLMSDPKFAEALLALGVTPPEKISPTPPHNKAWAFAKTDQGMKDLLEHDDPDVQALVAARLGVKSTIEESRTQRFINIGRLTFPGNKTNVLPVPLKPSGAHTHRLSGDWKLNLQNLTRANPVQKKRAMLRESIFTEEGYSMVVADESQIELRGTAMFCGQEDLLEACRDPNRDPYCEDATASRGYVVTKKDIGPRFCSKTKMLSCQYQVGWRKYRASVKHQSLEYIGMEIDLTEQEAFNDVHLYRTRNYKIKDMWNYLNYQVIPLMTDPRCDFMLGPVRVMFEQIVLPNGMVVHYHKLHKNPMTGDWQYVYGREIKKIYGGKFLENIIQALCRIIVMDVTLRVKKPFAKLFQSRLAMQSHDELMYVCRDRYAEELKGVLVEEMRKPPVWWPDIPLDVDCHIGNCYGLVK